MTAADNGGAVLSLGYTFKTAGVTACANNALILDVACVLSSGLGRPKSAVNDEYGGFCGSPSPNKPATCPAPAKPAANKTATNTTAKTNTTAAKKTRVLANTTAAANTSTVDVFV